MTNLPWRIGKKVPINVYDGDRPVCQCQTAEDAKLIVIAVNNYKSLVLRGPKIKSKEPE